MRSTLDFLIRFEGEENDFRDKIVMEDESWFDYWMLESDGAFTFESATYGCQYFSYLVARQMSWTENVRDFFTSGFTSFFVSDMYKTKNTLKTLSATHPKPTPLGFRKFVVDRLPTMSTT